MVDYTGCLSALQTVVTTYQALEKHPAWGEGQSQCSFPEDTSFLLVPKRSQVKNGQGADLETGIDRQPLVLLPLQTHLARLLPFMHGLDMTKHKGV